MDAGWCWEQALLWNHIKDAPLPPLHHESPMETRRSHTVQEQQIHRRLLASALMHRVRLKRCFSSSSVLIRPLWLAPCTPQPHLNQGINPGSTDFLWDFFDKSQLLSSPRETVLRWALGGEGTLPCLSSLSLSRYASATQCKLLLGPAVTVLSHLKGDKAEFVPLLNVQWHWCTALRSIIKTSHPQWEYWCACVWCCNVLSMAQTTPPPPPMENRSAKTRSLWLTWDSLTSFDLNRVVRRLIWFPEFRLGSMSRAINGAMMEKKTKNKTKQIAKWDAGCRWIWCVALTLGFQRASHMLSVLQ